MWITIKLYHEMNGMKWKIWGSKCQNKIPTNIVTERNPKHSVSDTLLLFFFLWSCWANGIARRVIRNWFKFPCSGSQTPWIICIVWSHKTDIYLFAYLMFTWRFNKASHFPWQHANFFFVFFFLLKPTWPMISIPSVRHSLFFFVCTFLFHVIWNIVKDVIANVPSTVAQKQPSNGMDLHLNEKVVRFVYNEKYNINQTKYIFRNKHECCWHGLCAIDVLSVFFLQTMEESKAGNLRRAGSWIGSLFHFISIVFATTKRKLWRFAALFYRPKHQLSHMQVDERRKKNAFTFSGVFILRNIFLSWSTSYSTRDFFLIFWMK